MITRILKIVTEDWIEMEKIINAIKDKNPKELAELHFQFAELKKAVSVSLK